ncbi:MAG: dTDP-4-dehydrorhamnose reductase [Thiogranum sp.]|nr:dTDP-4-dehydrorhamnose reductase [Thiogranum sp.]
MKLLITGASGQLGTDLVQHFRHRQIEVIALTSADVDFLLPECLHDVIAAVRPDWVINCAAYTQVDKAESEPDLAWRINAEAVGTIARAIHSCGGRMLQVSTDFVFDGSKTTPYVETDQPAPINVYGQTKYEGELLAQQYCDDVIILRSAWIFGASGRNFVKTILRLAGQRDTVAVVNDQQGTPSWTRNIAEAIDGLIAAAEPGIYHFANTGVTSWYGFAALTIETATAMGLLGTSCKVEPVTTLEYPTAARRPAYSALATGKISPLYPGTIPTWEAALEAMLVELKNA